MKGNESDRNSESSETVRIRKVSDSQIKKGMRVKVRKIVSQIKKDTKDATQIDSEN